MPDDGYRLLDGHYVGRVGCDPRGRLRDVPQPVGNFSLPQCKAKCNSLEACLGISYHRSSMHRTMRPPSNCLLMRKCTGRVVTTAICEPDPAIASDADYIARRSNVFNYMRVVPLVHAATSAPGSTASDTLPP